MSESHEERTVTESPKDLVREAERGQSERTPALLLGGVQLVVFSVVLVLVAVLLVVYFVIK